MPARRILFLGIYNRSLIVIVCPVHCCSSNSSELNSTGCWIGCLATIICTLRSACALLLFVDHFPVLAKENYASILSPYSSSADQHSHPIISCQMTTAIAIEDVRREVRILSSLSGHNNLVQFYDAFEDEDNVYIVME
jgi:hypothetical protein